MDGQTEKRTDGQTGAGGQTHSVRRTRADRRKRAVERMDGQTV